MNTTSLNRKMPAALVLLWCLFSISTSAALAGPQTSAYDTLGATSRGALKRESKMLSPEAEATYQDVKQTLGIVPMFIKRFPTMSVAPAWQMLKTVQLNPNSAIPAKYKELLGLAVASQVPCQHCSYFHTEFAKFNGATEPEIEQAIALGASTRFWSTYLNGVAPDNKIFTQDVDQMISGLGTSMSSGMYSKKTEFASAQETYDDIMQTFGFVPAWIRNYPSSGIAGAWGELKSLEINPGTPITGKYRGLISLGVSSQIPCTYCLYFDKKIAKADGATDQEIDEAIAIAATVRHWSAVIHGQQTEPAEFKKEVQQMLKHLKKSGKV